MRELGPDRLSDDGTYLIARDPNTAQAFRIRIDDPLRRLLDLAAQRTRSGRSDGHLEIPMESTLSPRDIQSRIRRGESPSSVADAAGVTTEHIEAFAAPVLAERAYMAEQARKTTIRRKHVGGTGVAMGALVDEHIAESGGVPESAHWDAWRREDGRWSVVVTPTPDHDPATFLFDVKSRYVLPSDTAAHDLVGDVAHPSESTDMALADAVRSVAVGQAVSTADHASVRSLKEARDRRALGQMALNEMHDSFDVEAGHDDHAAGDISGAEESGRREHEHDPYGQPSGAVRRDAGRPDPEDRSRRKHERRRVPSWDEIMFGGKDG